MDEAGGEAGATDDVTTERFQALVDAVFCSGGVVVPPEFPPNKFPKNVPIPLNGDEVAGAVC